VQHDNAVQHAGFSDDGRQLVTASADKTAKVWDAQTGKLLVGPLTHTHKVMRAAFRPDGRQVATVSWDGVASVWDAATGKRLGQWKMAGVEPSSLGTVPVYHFSSIR
jgi:WD40 repeat protein